VPRLLFAVLLAFAHLPAAAQVAVPPLAARVTDLTATLAPAERAALEDKLARFEARKGSQIAVLIVPTTQPEAIEQYSIRVTDAWKLGRKGVDDGVLLLVAKNDRKLRIEVGRGLEGVLPDAIAKRIVADTITPRFRENDFAGGVNAGVDRIMGTIDGEPLPPPAASRRSGGSTIDGELGFDILLAIGAGVMMLGSWLASIFGRLLGAGIVGLAAGGLAYALFNAIAGVAIGAIAFVLALLGGTGRAHAGRARGGGGWGSGGGFRGGGGGYSGGGGGFSGGGASGSW